MALIICKVSVVASSVALITFVEDEITFRVASVADISLFVTKMEFVAAKITYVVAAITLKVVVVTSLVVKISFVVDETAFKVAMITLFSG